MRNKSKNSRKKKAEDPLFGDLSNVISESRWQMVEFELKEKKNKVVSLRLSEKLYNELKKQAKAMGLDTQKFIRISLESLVKRKAG